MYNFLSDPGVKVEWRSFPFNFVSNIWPRIALTSFFKMSIPLEMIIIRWKQWQNTHLSIETSMLTPFCSLLEVSTVINISTILQLGNFVSNEQSYSRKLIISNSRTALRPLKTLLPGSVVLLLIISIWNWWFRVETSVIVGSTIGHATL